MNDDLNKLRRDIQAKALELGGLKLQLRREQLLADRKRNADFEAQLQHLHGDRAVTQRAVEDLRSNDEARAATTADARLRARIATTSAISDIESALEHVEPYVDVSDGADGPRPNDAMNAQSALQRALELLASVREHLT